MHMIKNIVTGSAWPKNLFTRKNFTKNLFSILGLQAFSQKNVRIGFYTPKTTMKELFYSIHSQMAAEQKFTHWRHKIPKIVGVAQGCHPGNQVEFVIRPHMNAYQQKNFIGMDISRFKY